MQADEARSLVERARDEGWIDPAAGRRCLDEYLERPDADDPGIDLLLVEEGVLSVEHARRLMKMAAPPALHGCRFVRKLGEGPHGKTVLVQQPETCASLSVKILPRELSDSAEYIERIERKAYAAQRAAHHAVVRTRGVVCEEGDWCHVWGYVPGASLDELFAAGHRFPPRVAVRRFHRVAQGLAAVWKWGVCHGHLTPSSIILAEDGSVRVTGVGLVRVPPRGIHREGAGVAVYHPAYLAPEHFQSGKRNRPPVDCRSDIFSLGTIFYQVMTGVYPFEGSTPEEIYHSMKHGAPEDPSHIDGSISRDLSAILARMLESDPAKRYQTHDELLDDLEDMRASHLPDVRPLWVVPEAPLGEDKVGGYVVGLVAGAVMCIMLVAIIAALLD